MQEAELQGRTDFLTLWRTMSLPALDGGFLFHPLPCRAVALFPFASLHQSLVFCMHYLQCVNLSWSGGPNAHSTCATTGTVLPKLEKYVGRGLKRRLQLNLRTVQSIILCYKVTNDLSGRGQYGRPAQPPSLQQRNQRDDTTPWIDGRILHTCLGNGFALEKNRWRG